MLMTMLMTMPRRMLLTLAPVPVFRGFGGLAPTRRPSWNVRAKRSLYKGRPHSDRWALSRLGRKGSNSSSDPVKTISFRTKLSKPQAEAWIRGRERPAQGYRGKVTVLTRDYLKSPFSGGDYRGVSRRYNTAIQYSGFVLYYSVLYSISMPIDKKGKCSCDSEP